MYFTWCYITLWSQYNVSMFYIKVKFPKTQHPLTPIPFPWSTPVMTITFLRSDQSIAGSWSVVLVNFTVSVRCSRPGLVPLFYMLLVNLPWYRRTTVRTTPTRTKGYTASMFTRSALFLWTTVIIVFIILVQVSVFFCMRVFLPFTDWGVRITVFAFFNWTSACTSTPTSTRVGPTIHMKINCVKFDTNVKM